MGEARGGCLGSVAAGGASKQCLEAIRFPSAADDQLAGWAGAMAGRTCGTSAPRCWVAMFARRRVCYCGAALMEARVMGDPAGNWKLAKGSQGGRRHRARDDAGGGCDPGGGRGI